MITAPDAEVIADATRSVTLRLAASTEETAEYRPQLQGNILVLKLSYRVCHGFRSGVHNSNLKRAKKHYLTYAWAKIDML